MEEARIIRDLARGGRRLMGFCRTNLFKRLESSGYAFLLSVERHILRNYIFLHALENGLPLPIGTQEAEMLDTGFEDEDLEDAFFSGNTLFDWTDADNDETMQADATMDGAADPVEAYRVRAGEVYQRYRTALRTRFRWLRHPGYAGGLLAYLATPLLLDAPWAFLPVGAVMALTVLRTALEDKTLQEELAGYRDYAGRVRYRLLPGVW